MTAIETSTSIASVKIVTHIFAEETFTCINDAETSNCIIATGTCRIDCRNFHLQKWCQSEILLVMIKKFSE